jgi:integrase
MIPPIPPGANPVAHLVRQQKTYYVDAHGKRVPKGTPKAKKVREKSAKWYGTGIPGLPPKKRVPLATDKVAARRMLDDLVRGAEKGQAGLPDADAGRKPLADYLDAFERDARLGLASRSRKTRRKPSAAQVALSVQRIRDILDGCEFDYPGTLNDDAPARLAEYLDGRLMLSRKDGGLSQQSAAFYLSAARRFAWWLSVKARAPVRADLFDDVPGFDPKSDRKHARRDITPDELAKLLTAARSSGQAIRGLTGEDRYFLYLVAFSTGYRAGELAELHPENFDLELSPPAVTLPSKFTKNKKRARQPLPPGVANQLRGYIVTKPHGQAVWPGTWSEKPAEGAAPRSRGRECSLRYRHQRRTEVCRLPRAAALVLVRARRSRRRGQGTARTGAAWRPPLDAGRLHSRPARSAWRGGRTAATPRHHPGGQSAGKSVAG